MLPKLFNALPAHSLSHKYVPKAEILFRQNDPTFGLFYVEFGSVVLRRHTENGTQIIIHNAHAGETFAEAALFSEVYHCDAITNQDSQIITISKAVILNIMAQNPNFAHDLSARFARQIQTYRRRLEIQAIRNAEQRVYTAIIEGMLQDSIKSMAAQIGLSHEAVYRALAKLVKRNMLTKIAHGQYSIN